MHVFHPFTNNAANNNDNNATNVFWSFIIDETCSYILFSQGIVVPCVSHESAGIYCYRVDVYTVKLIREKAYFIVNNTMNGVLATYCFLELHHL